MELNEIIKEKLKDVAKQVVEFREEQVIECIKQAILCGDFKMHMRAGSLDSKAVYLPYAEKASLEDEIKRMEMRALHLASELNTRNNQLSMALESIEFACRYYKDHGHLCKKPDEDTGHLDPEYAIAQDLEKTLDNVKALSSFEPR